ncbi:mucin-2-like isoform X1 [Haliotis rufescens]|uniref:mucin-2-like isoform X1 n=1 Tax=Haliotis rufescens TaxID=6454 RepID=UPI00201EA961|nr:mucin-2-like isoform X1 [Haliotis rufescens]
MEAFLCRLCIMIICSATGISGSMNLTRLLQAPAQMDQYTLVCRSDGRTDGGRVITWFRSGSKIFQTLAGPMSYCSMAPIQDVYNVIIKGDVTVSCEPTMHTVTFTLSSRADDDDEWWCQDQAGGQTGTSNHLELGPTAMTTHGLSTHGPSSYAMASAVTTITLPGGESSNTEEFSASTGSYTLASSSENTSPPGSNSRGPRGSSTIASSTDNTSSPGTKSPSSTGSSTIASSTENMSPHGTKSPSSTGSSTISPSTENTSPHGTKSPSSTGSSTISISTENTSPHGTKSPSSTVSPTISPSTENTSPHGTKSPGSTGSSTISPSTENTSPHGTKSQGSTGSSTISPSTENTSPHGTKSSGSTGSSTISISTENSSPHGTKFPSSTVSSTISPSTENTPPHGTKSPGSTGSSTISPSTENTSPHGTKSPGSTVSSTISPSTENTSPHGTKSPSSTASSTISPSTENTSSPGTKSPGSTGSSTISPSTENTSPHGTKSQGSTGSSTISPSTENTSPHGTKSPSSTVSSTISPSTENTSPHGTKSPSSTGSSTISPSTENTSSPGTKSPGSTGSSTIASSTENTSSPDRKPRGTDKVSVSTGRSTVTTARFTKHDDKDSSKRIYIIVGSVCGAVAAALAVVVVVVVIVCRRRREKDAASSVERLGHGHTEGSTCETRIESDPDYQEKIVMEDNNLYVRSSEVLPLDPSRNAENTDAAASSVERLGHGHTEGSTCETRIESDPDYQEKIVMEDNNLYVRSSEVLPLDPSRNAENTDAAASSVERLGHGHTEGSTCETRIESDPDYQEKIVMEDNNLYVRSSEVLPLDPSRNAENTDAAASSVERLGHGHTEGSTCETRIESDPDYQEKIVMEDNNLYVRSSEVLPLDPSRNAENTDAADVYAKVNKGQENKTEELTSL